jgi:hypothetical protein
MTRYDQDQVDGFLDQLVATVRSYEAAGKPTIV